MSQAIHLGFREKWVEPILKTISETSRNLIKNGKDLSPILIPVFGMLSSACLIGVGIKEVLLDSHPTWFRIHPSPSLPEPIKKVLRAADWLLCLARSQANTFIQKTRFTLHGLLIIGAGIGGGALALDQLGLIALGAAVPFVNHVIGGFIIAANLIYLEYNIEKFMEATKSLQLAKLFEKRYFIVQQLAAVLGIGSNISYILGSIATLLTVPFLYPLTLGAIALTMGGLRICLESYASYKLS